MHIALPGRELRASTVTKRVHWEVPSEQRSLDALRWVLIPSARSGFRVWKKLVGASTLTYNTTRNFWRPIHRSDAVSIRNMNN
jgi:hypothetical protein